MKENRTIYEELQKRLAEAEEVIQTLQSSQTEILVTGRVGLAARLEETEKTLMKSDALYCSVVEDVPWLLCSFLPDGEIVFVNTAYCEYFGKTREELISSNFTSLIPKKDRQEVLHEIESLTVDSPSMTHEHRVSHPDGRIRWHRWTNRGLFDEQGQAVLFQSFGEDISERKQAENELYKSEERFRRFAVASGYGFAMGKLDGPLVFANSTTLQIVEEEFEEAFTSKTFYQYYIPEDAERLRREILPIVLEKGQWVGEVPLLSAKGNQIATEQNIFLIRDDQGAPRMVGNIITEITERKKAEADLRESEKRFQQVVENAGDWIWEVDVEGLYTYASPVVENILGYKPEEIIGKKHFYDFFAPEVKEDLKRGAFEVFTRRENFKEFVNPSIHRNGSTVILETSGTPIIDEKGNLRGYRGADRDITERTQKENELRKLNADLVLASRRAGMAELATDILHNVGNVLNSINVSASFIEEKVSNSKAANLKKVIDILADHTGDLGTFLTEDARGRHIPLYLTEAARFILEEQNMVIERLQSLTKNVEHLKQIIKAQQSYARSGGMQELTKIDEVIEDAVETNQAALDRYGIDLQFELAELPEFRMDKQRVLQILVNVISNAKQALTASEESEKVLAIRSYKHHEDTLRIEVSDNGIGISGENLPEIFTYGFTTKKKGHGFGLHSSAVAAREMGGSLTVHSDGPGHGATFTLEIPLSKSGAIADG